MPTLADVPALPTVDIPNVELCSVGEWNGRLYTAAEFAEAARTATELRGVYHIPLKLGHDDGQTLTGQTDGDPALGWVENVRAAGNKLVGDLKNVPARLAQLIKSGAYRGRSAEFWLNTTYAGKARPFMLKAVALLGVDAPAVEGLADITTLYNRRQPAAVELARNAAHTVTLASERPSKTEGGTVFHIGDYAYTPDDTDPSTWKLRITKSPGGKPDAGLVGAAIAAFGRGFRGQKASIPTADRGAVKSRLRGAWRAANPEKSDDEMPDAIKNSRAAQLLRLPEAAVDAYLAWRLERPERRDLVSGPSVDEEQAAVMAALAAAGYPPAKGDEDDDDGTPGADGPSQNVLDWYMSGDQHSVIVSDQDVDNLFEIPYAYDADSGSVQLAAPIPVRGTYTPNKSGVESGTNPADVGDGTGAGDGSDATPPAAGDGTDGDSVAQNRRTLFEVSSTLWTLARSEPELTALRALSRVADDRPAVHQLAQEDVQQAVQKILAQLDQTLADLGATAAGKPGMGFIRTTLSEVQRKLKAMKFPKPASTPPAAAQNTRLTRAGGTAVELPALARRLGLPETATEAQIDVALAARAPAPAAPTETITTLARQVAQLAADKAERDLAETLDRAAQEGRLTKPVREELVKLARTAGVETVRGIVQALPVVVDLRERGRDGDAPRTAGQLRPGVVAILSREDPHALEAAKDARSLREKRDAVLRENEQARLARLSRRAS